MSDIPYYTSGKTNINQIAISSTTSTTVLNANSGRRYVSITNEGPWTVYLNLGRAAVKRKGVALEGGSDKHNSWETYAGKLFTSTVTAISNTASSQQNVSILEGEI